MRIKQCNNQHYTKDQKLKVHPHCGYRQKSMLINQSLYFKVFR